MISVYWLPQAMKDLVEIYDYFFQDNPLAADIFENQIYLKIAKLLKFPRMGRMVPEIEDPVLREIIWLKYRIIYRIRLEQIEIVTIFHGNRDFSLI